MQNEIRYVLEARSSGKRGAYGRRKRYDIAIDQDNPSRVLIAYGKSDQWWTATLISKSFPNSIEAVLFVDEQMRSKLKKGYELVGPTR